MSLLIQVGSILLWSYLGLHTSTITHWPAWLSNDQWQYRLGWNWLSYFIGGVLLAQWHPTPLRQHFFSRVSMGLTLGGLLVSVVYASFYST